MEIYSTKMSEKQIVFHNLKQCLDRYLEVEFYMKYIVVSVPEHIIAK